MDRARRLLIFLLAAFASSGLQAGADLAALAARAVEGGQTFVAAQDGARFLPADLRFAAKLAATDAVAAAAPAVEAITDFNDQLHAAGIRLLVMPVPPRALYAGADLGIDPQQQDAMRAGWEGILAALASRGVAVEDLLSGFAASDKSAHCLRDTHWSGHGIAIAADKLAARLGQEPGFQMRPFGGEWKSQSIQGDLGGEPEDVELRFPGATGAAAEQKRSPVVLLGDSHLLVFHQGGDMHAAGAGLADQMAFALEGMPDVIAVRGSGATSSRLALARRARGEAGFLASKKAVIWCFAGRDFTEAGAWKKVPILRSLANAP